MKLTVSNFQIHREPATVDIPEGETTYLEGDSDTGKSAMLRAIRWLCENKPDGGSFVTFKTPRGTNARVLLEVDGGLVMRERGKSTNLYKLDGETFEAFGRSVPEPVQRALRMSPYAFQLQGEPSFLIGSSPTEAAKMLSEACGLGVIDTAVGCVRAKKTVVEAEIRKGEILLESAQQRLATSEGELPLADALEAAVALADESAALVERVNNIENALDDAPQGEMLDLAVAQERAAAAREAAAEVQDGIARLTKLRAAYVAEPTGALFELGDTALVVEAARTNLAVYDAFLLDFRRLSAAIADEPRGEIVDVSGARSRFGEAKIAAAWLEDVSKAAARMRQLVTEEPAGISVDTVPLRTLRDTVHAVERDVLVLEQMRNTMRVMILAEPSGALMDTAELTKQRAQIKVCPTCGKEL